MKFKRLTAILAVVLMLISLASCSASGQNDAASNKYFPGASEEMNGYGDKTDNGASDGESGSLGSLEAITENITSQKLIQYVTVSLETTDYDATVSAIKQRASALGGYIESSNERGLGTSGKGYRYSNIVFRIPSDVLDEFKGKLAEWGNLLYMNIDSKDVTESYYDIEARLASLEAQRDRYMELLDRAETLDEIIVIDNALTEVLYKIESYTGTLNKYDSLVAYSTVTVDIQEVKKITEPEEEPETFGERLAASFGESVEMLVEFFKGATIGAVSVLPWLILPGAVVVIILVCVNKKSKAKKNKDESADDE